MKTLFEKIIAGELPAEKVYEDEKLIAIKDKYPKAPIHLLIIPKKPIPGIQTLQESDFPLLAEMIRVVQKLAMEWGVEEEGYRLLVNQGPDGGQTVPHLHFHLLAGRPLGTMG